MYNFKNMESRQVYKKNKYWNKVQFSVRGRENAIAQLTKFIQELPYEHEILISIFAICGSERYLADLSSDTVFPIAPESEPPAPHGHNRSPRGTSSLR